MWVFSPLKTWWSGWRRFLPESAPQEKTSSVYFGGLPSMVVLGWAVLSLGWLSVDRVPRDGDEEGHVGAAELFLGDLSQGDWGGFFERLWMGLMGEYPQAFTAGVGMWWWLFEGGEPGRVAVRGVCLASLAIAALCTGRIARRYVGEEARDTTELAAVICVLALPLGNGLTRHFMPEGALIAAVAVSVWLAHRLVERPSVARAVVLGLCLGMGVLTKQTFLILAVVPVLWVLRRMGRQGIRLGLLSFICACVVAGPWIMQNSVDQLAYGASSVFGHGDGGWWEHLQFYPVSLALLGLGPPLMVLMVLSVWHLRSVRDRRALWMGAAWLIGGLLILLLVPKKYPRLMAPLLPAVAIWIAIASSKLVHPKRWIMVGGIAVFGWLGVVSTVELPLHPARPAIDPGCPQVWVRPPNSDDLGLAAIADVLRTAPPGPVRIIADPSIPCAIQTTHDWSAHLSPRLRHLGQERAVITDARQPHRVVIDWNSGPGQKVDVPVLGVTAHIRDNLAP
jgi:hypothetical protein